MRVISHRIKVLLALLFVIALYCVDVSAQDSMYFVRATGIIPEVYSQKKSLFALTSSDENFSLPDTPFQHVIRTKKITSGVEVCIETGTSGPANEKNLNRYLADTRLLEITSAEIQSLKKKFSSSQSKLDDVMRFVYNYITNKSEGIPIVSARTVLQTRTGDCTEHAVLTVALLRALGIPARAVVGMILCREFGHYHNVFVFHMWAEAFTGGRWVLVDSTRPSEIHPNRYIAFAVHNLRAEMPLEYLSAVASIKNLSVKYLEKVEKK